IGLQSASRSSAWGSTRLPVLTVATSKSAALARPIHDWRRNIECSLTRRTWCRPLAGVLRPQPQRARVHPHHERVGALHRFPVDVEEHRFAGPYRDLSHAMRIDSGAPIDTACEQSRHAQYVPDKSAMVNSDEIQQAILEIRSWSDLRSEAPLLRVRDDEHERGRLGRAPVDLDRVVDRPVAKEIAGARG